MVQKAENAHERFEEAALALFHEKGYAQTTVPEIAARAGMNERTFYRYFLDKPEVLFWRTGELHAAIINVVKQAPKPGMPVATVIRALESVSTFFDVHRADVIARQTLVAANPDFRERETMKARSLALAIDEALRGGGIDAPDARIASELGISLWKVARERWSEDEETRSLSHHIHEALKRFRALLTDKGGSV